MKFEQCSKTPLENDTISDVLEGQIYRCLERGVRCNNWYAHEVPEGLDCYYEVLHK